jgi:hypothetical protein
MKRAILGAAILAGVTAAQTSAAACNAPPAFMEVIKAAQEANRSVTFFLQGTTVPLVITKIIDQCTVEGRNRQFDRVVIRLSSVAGVGS